MNKLLKFALGALGGAAVAHVAYYAYQDMADELRAELIGEIRARYAAEAIAVVWIFDDPKHEAVFPAGLVLENGRAIELEIDAETLEIKEVEK